jgi:hypothetical protein
MANIDLVVSTAQAQPEGGPGAFKINMNTANVVGISGKVFVCEQSEVPGQEDSFLCVATPEDMLSLPESPDGTGVQLRYRTDAIELFFSNEDYSESEEFIESVRRRIRSLLLANKALQSASLPRTYSIVA